MLPVFLVLVAASVVLALVAAPAPTAAAVVAYRVDFYTFFVSSIVAGYGDSVASALVSDLAGVFNTDESAITVQDRILLPDTAQSLGMVFTVEGGDDATFLASPLEAQADWANAFNQMVYAYYTSIYVARNAAAAAYENYNAYITKVERLGSPSLLPKRRYLELTLHGKHLLTASADPNWPSALGTDLGNAFGISDFVSTHLALSASASSGVNNSTLSVRFSVKPLLNVAVNSATFFATNGTASWLSLCQNIHTTAAAEDLGINLGPDPVPGGIGRIAAALGTVPESESALTVTGTAYAPGDESYTDAPTPAPATTTTAPGSVTNAPGSVTNAPGDAAPGVTTAAVFIAATALLSVVSLF
jgi:hypothetical protein